MYKIVDDLVVALYIYVKQELRRFKCCYDSPVLPQPILVTVII